MSSKYSSLGNYGTGSFMGWILLARVGGRPALLMSLEVVSAYFEEMTWESGMFIDTVFVIQISRQWSKRTLCSSNQQFSGWYIIKIDNATNIFTRKKKKIKQNKQNATDQQFYLFDFKKHHEWLLSFHYRSSKIRMPFLDSGRWIFICTMPNEE